MKDQGRLPLSTDGTTEPWQISGQYFLKMKI